MQASKLILGLRELPRPAGDGYVYYKFAPNEADRVLVFLNLYNTDESELENLFRQAFSEMARQEKLPIGAVRRLLSDYSPENMKPRTQEILASAIGSFADTAAGENPDPSPY